MQGLQQAGRAHGYAYIAEAIGYKPVKDLYLIYFEPPYKETYEAITDGHTNGDGCAA